MDSRRTYVLCAAGAAAGTAAFLLLRSGREGSSRAVSTDFDAFLRTPRPQPGPVAAQRKPGGSSSTDFASFLRSSPADPAAAAACSGVSQVKQPEVVPEGAVPLLVLFGTEYGFAREIAEKAAEQLKAGGTFWPRLVNAADHPEGLTELAQHQAALLVFSTQGDGVPPTEARDFCDWLTAGGPGALPGLNYSVCALGDSSYTHFCRCGKQLDAALAAAGAKQLAARADIDREDWPAVDGWLQASAAALDALAATGGLKTWADLGGAPTAAAVGDQQQQQAAAKKHSKSRPYYARVAAVDGLCVLSGPDDKDTLRLRLELGPGAVEAGLGYAPGDALGIWPTNPPALVDELLTQLGLSGDEAVPPPSWHYQEQRDTDDQNTSSSSSSSLRHLLGVAYDLKTPKLPQLLTLILEQLRQQQAAAAAAVAGGRPSFDLQADATAAGAAAPHPAAAEEQQDAAGKAAPKEQQQQAELAACVAAAESLLADAAAAEAYLAPRHVADVLQDFPSASLTTQQLLSVLRPLAPRLYSISSSPLEFSPAASGVEATIAVVRYTVRGKQRQGVASTQVAERVVVGGRLPVFISKNPDFRLPAQPSRPIIMVGPGTGLAPFRAFIQHRLLEAAAAAEAGTPGAGDDQQQQSAASAAVGPMHLFFGCRRRDQDFLYGDQLQTWAAAGSITLHTAFSREGPAKVYVQQRLREAGQQVWALLQAGGHFYVCGDAGSMAGAVEAALLEVIGQGSGAGEAGARACLDQLAAEGRYQRDVWFS